MKRNLIYSVLVFSLLFSWIVSGAITQLSMGILSSDDLGFVFGVSFGIAGFIGVIFFVVLRAVRDKYFSGSEEVGYHPSRTFSMIAASLLMISIIGRGTCKTPILCLIFRISGRNLRRGRTISGMMKFSRNHRTPAKWILIHAN